MDTSTASHAHPASPAPYRASLTRLGGALGMAAAMIGLLVFIAGCFGFTAAFPLAVIVLVMAVPALVISVVGAVRENGSVEDPHPLGAIFASGVAVIGGLLLTAIWKDWKLFY